MRIAIGIGGPALAGRDEWRMMEEFVIEAERLGVDSCWSAEAWGQDAIAPLAYVAARTTTIRIGTGVAQISARAAATTAMTAMTLATISGDRFSLGLGVSGPQVVEGLHGVPFDKPLTRLDEYLDILELAFSGRPLDYHGTVMSLPIRGSSGPAMSLAGAAASPIPVYLAALGPKALELTGARADGWLASGFIPEASAAFLDPIRRGAEAAGRDFGAIDLQAGGPVAFGDDLDHLLHGVKRTIAFRVGAMGSPQQNFYKQAYERAGYVDEVNRIQSLWLDGRRREAVDAVTDDIARSTSFVGTDEQVTARIRAFRAAGITTLWPEFEEPTSVEKITTLARFVDLVRAVDA